jgi:alkylation response protein AidB-like acyl-CoA dehydrogenase
MQITALFEIASAKLRTNKAIGQATAIAHQVHGAIGFTQEYDLHKLTGPSCSTGDLTMATTPIGRMCWAA